jgi:hypothetical protein
MPCDLRFLMVGSYLASFIPMVVYNDLILYSKSQELRGWLCMDYDYQGQSDDKIFRVAENCQFHFRI